MVGHRKAYIVLILLILCLQTTKTVRDAWKDLYDKYCVQNPDAAQLKKIQNAQYKLLETISKSLGYKDKVTWETIQNPYVPAGMIKQWQEQAKSQQAYNTLLNTMANIVPKEQKNTEEQK